MSLLPRPLLNFFSVYLIAPLTQSSVSGACGNKRDDFARNVLAEIPSLQGGGSSYSVPVKIGLRRPL